MGNCCGSEDEITGVVVCDPETRQVARVAISPTDNRRTLNSRSVIKALLILRAVRGHQRKKVPEHWRTLEVFCEDTQAVNKKYDIHPNNDRDRHPQVWVQTVNFGQLRYPKKSTDRVLYFGRIPN
ncbi:MAG: hypothetical protein Q9175_002799 [Cornicularia normoerica]